MSTGCFGLGIFVLFFKLGTSILAASLTLAIMTLPVVISTAEEALRAVPQSFRVVSISLGATQWQTIRQIVRTAIAAGHPDRRDPGAGARRWRNGADPVHRGSLLPAQPAPIADG